jgi:serine/threonine protein kinase
MEQSTAQPPPPTPPDAIPAATAQGAESVLEACDGAGLAGEGGAAPAPRIKGPGTRIGRYKLLQLIAEGGMGSVFMAEQEHPVRRRVALKIVKPGMDTSQVIARFEAERQALAMMDHANIARVLDAGATDAGRPYFVMELVQGVPITDYCDKHQLTPRERLGLFVQVCHALQHAHQKGIIHRDVKPSNVLVAICDGKPVPKVIDFGIAKALHQRLTEKTLFTQFGGIVGTIEYMSPEQADSDVFAADTRSDVYSLGVLLYELLTGTTPLQRKHLLDAGWAEMLRQVRETEPPKPSTRISQSGEALAGISARRQTEPHKLGRLVSGDLDWVTMKALEKDRGRRYETASALARDVERYLNNELVEARPPSATDALRRFTRKHRGPLAAATAVFASLCVGLLIATLAWAQARHERNIAVTAKTAEALQRQKAEDALALAERRRVSAADQARRATAATRFLNNMLSATNPDGSYRPGVAVSDVTVRELLKTAGEALDAGVLAAQPSVEAEARVSVGNSYLVLGFEQDADRHLTAALLHLRRAPDVAARTLCEALCTFASLRSTQGRDKEAEALLNDALRVADRAEDYRDGLRADALTLLGLMAHAHGDNVTAERLQREVLELVRRVGGEEHPAFAANLANLSNTLRDLGRLEEAEAMSRDALRRVRSSPADRHLNEISNLTSLYYILMAQEDLEGAVKVQREKLEAIRQMAGEDHPAATEIACAIAFNLVTIGEVASAKRLLTDQYAKLKAYRNCPAATLVPLLEQLITLHERDGVSVEAEDLKSRLRELLPQLIDEGVARATHEMRKKPDDAMRLFERGLWFARGGRFQEAAKDWAGTTEMYPAGEWYWYNRACLLAYLGDVQTYQEVCQQSLSRFADSNEAGVVERLTKCTALLAYPGQDLAGLRGIAARCLVTSRSDAPRNVPWVEFASALIAYRSGEGHYEAAMVHIDSARRTVHHGVAEVALDLLRSLTLHRMGKIGEASAAYERAEVDFRRKTGVAGTNDLKDGDICNWFICQILHREAEQLIGGRVSSPTTKPALVPDGRR